MIEKIEKKEIKEKIKINDIYKFIDKIAPFETAMEFDNCGLLVGDKDRTVGKVILSLDITKEVVEEATKEGAELIISHHPVIFNPIKRIDSTSVVHSLCRNNISAICAHTNLDMANEGVNYSLAKRIGLSELTSLSTYKTINLIKISVSVESSKVLYIKERIKEQGASKVFEKELKKEYSEIEVLCLPTKINDIIEIINNNDLRINNISETYLDKENISLGLVGKLKREMRTEEFLQYLKERLSCEGLRYIDIDKNIKKVAVCSGSGGSLVNKAIEIGADAFITGEIKHHEILFAKENGILVVDAGHYKTEDVIIDSLIQLLSERFKDISFMKSKVFNDGVKYC